MKSKVHRRHSGITHSVGRLIVALTLLNFAYSAGSVNAQTTSIPSQTVSSEPPVIRIEKQEIPVYQYYVFFDQRLEIAPRIALQFTGPVFSNDDSYVMANQQIDFDCSFESAGNLFYGRLSSGSIQEGPINFKDDHGFYQPMKIEDSWLDSLNPDFLELAEERWGGQVQTKEFGVRPFDSGFGLHRYVDPTVPVGVFLPDGSINELMNPGYVLVEPMLSQNHMAFKGPDRELKKIAANACLVAKITGEAPDYQITLWKYVYDSGSIVYDELTGMPRMVRVRLPDGLIGAVASDMRSIDFEGNGIVEYYQEDDASKVTRGLYDARERRDMNLVTIDIDRLRELVDSTDPDYIPFADAACPWTVDTGGISRGQYSSVVNPDVSSDSVFENEPTEIFNPESKWNGVLYVQFPTQQHVAADDLSPQRSDLVVSVSDADLALQMINASVMPSEGLFLATNAPFYSVGHVNADGLPSTGSSITPDTPDEPSVGFAGECFTALSEGWYPYINNSRSYSNSSLTNRKAVDTEFSGAVLTGLPPTIPSGRYSGGFENTLRFLENWTKHTLTYRGAISVLFEPETHASSWGLSDIYRPPLRKYGYHQSFSNGNYPPFVPVLTRKFVPRIVIKEIMFAPPALTQKELDAGFSDPEDFEFIRLYNAEKHQVDMTGVAVKDAIDYAFTPGFIIDPQTDFVLVKNEAAFVFRYGDDSIIVGSYTGNLNNQGGDITIIGSRDEIVDEIIQTVRFSGETPWPSESASQGHSLVQSHLSYQSSLTDLVDWQASASPLGFPAQESDYNYLSWLEEHFTQEQIGAGLSTGYLIDLEKDGFNNLMEYAFGFSPFEFNSSSFIKHVSDDNNQNSSIDFSYRYLPGVADISYKVKQSLDLDTWMPATSHVYSITDNQDGTKTMNVRQPIVQGQSVFFTLEIETSP